MIWAKMKWYANCKMNDVYTLLLESMMTKILIPVAFTTLNYVFLSILPFHTSKAFISIFFYMGISLSSDVKQ